MYESVLMQNVKSGQTARKTQEGSPICKAKSHAPVIQLYRVTESYKISNTQDANLYADGSEENIPAPPASAPGAAPTVPGILYEVICRDTEADAVVRNFESVFAHGTVQHNAGLSIVANKKYSDTPFAVHGRSQNNPMIHIEGVTWGHIPSTNGISHSVPFFELRRRAASNPGARKIFDYIDTRSSKVWRRTGDNDITFRNPAPQAHDPQITALEAATAGHPGIRMVTAAYNLKSPDQSYLNAFGHFAPDWMPPAPGRAYSQAQRIANATNNTLRQNIQHGIRAKIERILDCIYTKEAILRKFLVSDSRSERALISAGVTVTGTFTYYPAEPTTYYQADADSYDEMVHTQVQQIKEGQTMKEKLGIEEEAHAFLEGLPEPTGAGQRNDSLISALLNSVIQTAVASGPLAAVGTYQFTITPEAFLTEVTGLDQSYFNPDTLPISHDSFAAYRSFVNELVVSKIYTNLVILPFQITH